MTDYKELISALREEAEAVKAVEWDIPICTSNHIAEAADVIEQLVKDLHEALEDERHAEVYAMKMKEDRDEIGKKLNHVITAYDNETVRADRLEAENRAKEQYIAETIGKVIKERDAAIADLKELSDKVQSCKYCKNDEGSLCKWYVEHPDDNENCEGKHFEWRGVQEVSK